MGLTTIIESAGVLILDFLELWEVHVFLISCQAYGISVIAAWAPKWSFFTSGLPQPSLFKVFSTQDLLPHPSARCLTYAFPCLVWITDPLPPDYLAPGQWCPITQAINLRLSLMTFNWWRHLVHLADRSFIILCPDLVNYPLADCSVCGSLLWSTVLPASVPQWLPSALKVNPQQGNRALLIWPSLCLQFLPLLSLIHFLPTF